MSVRHYLLPVTDAELASVLRRPEQIRALVERRSGDVTRLESDGAAIVSLTARGDDDPLAFVRTGAPDDVSGWVGKYAEADGSVIECEVDMGYGPASYYRNGFLREVARKLRPITVDVFEADCDLDWLEDHVHPGGWRGEGRKGGLLESFARYRTCVLTAARTGRHLLVWAA